MRFKIGDRLRSIGYPVEPTGTVTASDSIYYQVQWDDGKTATYRHKPRPQTGRVEHFDFSRHERLPNA